MARLSGTQAQCQHDSATFQFPPLLTRQACTALGYRTRRAPHLLSLSAVAQPLVRALCCLSAKFAIELFSIIQFLVSSPFSHSHTLPLSPSLSLSLSLSLSRFALISHAPHLLQGVVVVLATILGRKLSIRVTCSSLCSTQCAKMCMN